MLEPSFVVKKLHTGGVSLATGVPDSLLASFCQYLETADSAIHHIPNTNEGGAIALAAGHHLGTGQLGLVYLQNSGLGNAINPLASLTSPKVCGIPMVLMIGWRGEITEMGEQVTDEPQHVHQGAITLPLLDLLNIPFWILSSLRDEAEHQIDMALASCRSLEAPVALIARKALFSPPTVNTSSEHQSYPLRESFISSTFSSTPYSWPVVSTTGKAAREAYEISKQLKNSERAFFCVGAMGHAIQIATGLALKSDHRVICIDGDGAALMHLGSFVVSSKIDRLVHILINNGVHESVGSQRIADQDICFARLAKEFGYKHTYRVKTLDAFEDALKQSLSKTGSIFIEALTVPGSRSNLARPKETPQSNKQSFMNFILSDKDPYHVL